MHAPMTPEPDEIARGIVSRWWATLYPGGPLSMEIRAESLADLTTAITTALAAERARREEDVRNERRIIDEINRALAGIGAEWEETDLGTSLRNRRAEAAVHQRDALVAALRATDRRTDPFDDEPCWCGYARLTVDEQHSGACKQARAALARVEKSDG